MKRKFYVTFNEEDIIIYLSEDKDFKTILKTFTSYNDLIDFASSFEGEVVVDDTFDYCVITLENGKLTNVNCSYSPDADQVWDEWFLRTNFNKN